VKNKNNMTPAQRKAHKNAVTAAALVCSAGFAAVLVYLFGYFRKMLYALLMSDSSELYDDFEDEI